jgi:hypothetical protein
MLDPGTCDEGKQRQKKKTPSWLLGKYSTETKIASPFPKTTHSEIMVKIIQDIQKAAF